MNLRRHLPVFLLIAAALLLRFLTQSGAVAGWWVNVSPVMALAFLGGALLPGRTRWIVLGGVLAVDALCVGRSLMDYAGILITCYLCIGLAIFWGARLQRTATGLGLVGRLLGVSVGFYLVTNSASWLLSPEYAKSVSGWLQALTIGQPGFPPTWIFFRNALISDLGFGALLLMAHNLGQRGNRFSPDLSVPWVRRHRTHHPSPSPESA